ncbi:homoserine O-acetyltransferase MetX [Ktedonospora formicarum]|uniref:Homoserine O-acetyltransferase n=1 Tax=Ktedonospora formicarum TaxID=2778364 RepID=A0A8J3HT42_9CHLR|nr:homoserine O-acetyltransferase [Ktedonospora formicarum]GHO43487.1 homoserine O-acetyltransferase [Ktedonospora formicarum]
MVAQLNYTKMVQIPILEQQQVHTFSLDRLSLQRGGLLGPIQITYETWGTLNALGTNAILITHALTGDTHAHDTERPDDPKAAWWNLLIGPGRPIDTDRYFVVCANVLGGCSGSTGPASIDPRTERPYGMRFPLITIHDMVRAQHALLEDLGVRQLASVYGGSIGGQQALTWAVLYPEMVQRVVVIAASAALSAQGIAFNEVARQVIMADPLWNCGDYAAERAPATGLAIARMLAMITYQSEVSMDQRFGRHEARREEVVSPTAHPDLGGRFDVENYLYHQGGSLARRFDANSYIYLSRAMDLFDISEGFSSLEAALARISSKALFIGINTDFLFPAKHVRALAEKVSALGGDATYIELDSPHGHDAFLKEWEQMAVALQQS